MKKLKVIYVYDAHCSWCFAFSTVIQKIQQKRSETLDFEVISGGMVIGEQIGKLADRYPPEMLLGVYKRITDMTGTIFGADYLAKVKAGNVYINSEIPAIALSVFKEKAPEKAVDFAHAIQEQLFLQAKTVNDEALYQSLAIQFGLDSEAFLAEMKMEKYEQAARYDFALSRQLKVSGYPQVLVQTDDSHFYLIAKGYTDFASLDQRIEQVIQQLQGK